MWNTLRAIIADIGNTDISANTGFLNYSGNSVQIDSPLTISRIVVATAHPVGDLRDPTVTLRSATGSIQGPLPEGARFLTEIGCENTAENKCGDVSFGNLLMKGQTVQLVFPDPGLPPQITELEFSGPACPNSDPCDVFLLFDILTKASLRIEDAAGQALPPGDTGNFQLQLGGDYRIVAELLNLDDSKVDLSHPGMKNASFQLEIDGRIVTMRIDPTSSEAVYEFSPTTQDTDVQLRAEPVLPGFGTPPSEIAHFDVIDTSANLFLGRFEPELTCTDCAEGEHRAEIGPDAPTRVITFEVGNRARSDGAIRFDLSAMHPAFRLARADGSLIESGDEFDMAQGEAIELSLLTVRPFRADSVSSNPVLNEIEIHPAGAWIGPSITARLRSRLDAADLAITDLNGVEPCNGCPPNMLRSLLRPGADDVLVGQFTLNDPSEINGAIRLEISGNNTDFYLTDEAGNAFGVDGVVLEEDEGLVVRIMRRGILQSENHPDAAFQLRVTAERSAGWAPGRTALEFSVAVPAPDLKIWVHSHDSDPKGSSPLEMSGQQLRNGEASSLIALENLLDRPPDGALEGAFDFKLDSIFAPFHNYAVLKFNSVPDHDAALGVFVKPSAQYWCLCFIGIGDMFGTGRRELRIQFLDPVNAGMQRGTTSLLLQYRISTALTAMSCAWNLFYLVLMIIFIRGVMGGLAARRFPRHSEVEVHSPETGELFDDMRRTNWTWLRCWATIFVGPPHERITVEGMQFEATVFGPGLVVEKSVPAWRAEGRGNKLLEDLTVEGEPLLQMFWGDKLVDFQSPQNVDPLP